MSTINVNLMADSQGGSVAPISSVMRNRIINGGMTIDQRNAGASVSVVSGNPKFVLDRFYCDNFSASAIYSAQQIADAPIGFNYSVKVTVTTASAVAPTEYQYIRQNIEGNNIADLGFGTTTAKQFTLSFWVKASLTGTFGGFFGSQSNLRFQSFSYVINSANTWEYKSVTISGDTLVSSSNWNTTNGLGLQVGFSLSCGTTYQGATGSWGNSLLLGATGQTNLTATNGATFYITGVQLEKGTQATGFEYRQYGTELALCERYFALMNIGTCIDVTSGGNYGGNAYFSTTMRAAPTNTWISNVAAFRFPSTAPSTQSSTVDGFQFFKAANSSGTAGSYTDLFSSSAEL